MGAVTEEFFHEGEVLTVSFQAGRDDLLVITFSYKKDEHSFNGECWILTKSDDLDLWIDGNLVTVSALLPYLWHNRCRVKIYPRNDRYGAATKAEFFTETP